MAATEMRAAQTPEPDLLRCSEVVERFGVSKTQLYRLIRSGHFPSPIRIGERSVRWRRADLDRWLATQPTVMPAAASVDPAAGAAKGAG